MNSWLPLIGWPDLSDIERAIDTASVSANRVIASASGDSWRRVSGEKSGMDSGGNCWGRAPTIWIPEVSSLKARLNRAAARLPAAIATIMLMPPKRLCASMPVSNVITATSVTSGCKSLQLIQRNSRVLNKCAPSGMSIPRKSRACLAAIRQAAPAVNPTTTEWDMKFTSAPRRTAPMINCSTPTMKASVIASEIYSALPGVATPDSEANMITEAAVVGPETRCQDEPNSAAMTAGTILV